MGVFIHFPVLSLFWKVDLHVFEERAQRTLCLIIQGRECLAVSHARKMTENINVEGLLGRELKMMNVLIYEPRKVTV